MAAPGKSSQVQPLYNLSSSSPNPKWAHNNKNNNSNPSNSSDVNLDNLDDGELDKDINVEGKLTWNLQPPKEKLVKPAAVVASSSKKKAVAKSHGRGHGGAVVESKKSKFTISLSRDEIKEDLYALTGGKLPRCRPTKKGPKNVQKCLDNLFPGLYLVGMAPDSYRIS